MYLDELRNQINDIDDKIVELFVERMKVASEIAGAKAEKICPYWICAEKMLCRRKSWKRQGKNLSFMPILFITPCLM